MIGWLSTTLTVWLFTYGVALVIRILAGLGISFVTYSAADVLLDLAEAYVFTNFEGIPSAALSIMTIAGFDQGLRIMFSGWAAFITIKATLGAFSRWNLRPATLRA